MNNLVSSSPTLTPHYSEANPRHWIISPIPILNRYVQQNTSFFFRKQNCNNILKILSHLKINNSLISSQYSLPKDLYLYRATYVASKLTLFNDHLHGKLLPVVTEIRKGGRELSYLPHFLLEACSCGPADLDHPTRAPYMSACQKAGVVMEEMPERT